MPPLRLSRRARPRIATFLAALVLAVTLGACGGADGVAPTGAPDLTPPAPTSGSGAGNSTGGNTGGNNGGNTGGNTGSGTGGGSRSIEQWETDEKARVDAEKDAQQAVYDSLKVHWQEVLDDETGKWDDVLVCDPLQYVATVKVVGPEGGDVDFGPHKLKIPAGALSQTTVITAEAPTSLTVLARFSPHGTVFAAGRHPTLELSYKHCRNPPGHTARIGYLSTNGTVIEWPPSQDFPEFGLVRGWIGHFSSYIVAY